MLAKSAVRRMTHLASKFTGLGGVHVVDPCVDLRQMFDGEHAEQMKRSLEERRSKVDIVAVKKEYDEWWSKYNAFKNADPSAAGALKKEMRAAQAGLLAALSLPNSVHSVGSTEKRMLKPTKHTQYMTQQGLMRIDKDNEVVHLIGYPVTLQRALKEQLLDLFSSSLLMSPSYFQRAAILEALNVDLKDYSAFNDGSDSFPLTFLMGHSLASMVSLFLKTQFIEGSNQWPLTFQSSGMGYASKRGTVDLAYARQRLKHCVLTMSLEEADLDSFIAESATKIAAWLHEELLLDVKPRIALGKELHAYESQAIIFESDGLKLARISRIGDYVSRRLNTVTDKGRFVQMAYVETDINRVLARVLDELVEGKEAPRTLRDAVKSSKF